MNIHKHALMYASAIVLIGIGFSLALHFAGPQNSWINYISYVAYIAITVLALKSWRDTAHNGIITYGKSFGYLTYVALYYSLMISIWTYLFFTVIMPEDLQVMKDFAASEQARKMAEMHMDDETRQKSIEMANKVTSMFMNPGIMTLFAFFGNMIFLTIINLVTAAFMKKDPPAPAFQQPNFPPAG